MRKDYIPMDKCIERRLYSIGCRNFSYGIYDGKGGFMGIRYKFGSRYLFTELHEEASKHFGTVYRHKDLGIDLPLDIELNETTPTVDKETGREVYFDVPISQGGNGWVFKDTNELDENIKPISYTNMKLFKWLEERIKEQDEI